MRNRTGADRWGEVKKLVASDAAVNDYFGQAVAISEDTLVVGAYGKSSDQGAAYVFTRNKNGADQWGRVATLTASDAAAGDGFGWSAAISGDTLIVGAPSNSDAGAESGSAYVFERNKNGADQWGQVAKLVSSDLHAGDLFGWSVTVDDDILAVGASQSSQAGVQGGAAYIFGRNEDGADAWGEVVKLTAADAAADDQLGYALALDGDTLVAGALNADAGTGTGAAYVFERNEDGADAWGQTAKLIASDPANFDGFGNSVAISRDRIVVGAPAKADAGTYSGVIYVFERNYDPANPGVPSAGRWGQRDKLAPLDTAMGDLFGWSVSISGNALAAGARYDDNTGSATVYYLTTASADLGLSKAVAPASAAPGQAITYTLAFSNSGSITATQVVLTDSVPVSATVAGVVSSGAAITQVGGTRYVWQVQDLAPGQGGVITVSGMLTRPLAAGTFTNTATLAAANTLSKTGSIGLSVSNVAPTAEAGPAQTVLGGQPVTLDGSGSFDDNGDALTYGWVQTGGRPVVLSSGVVSRPTFTAPGTPAVLTFTLAVTDSRGLASTPDEVVITVNAPVLGLVKSASPASAAPGEAITYTLAFSNTGNSAATGVILTDSVPVSVTVASVVSSGAAITQVAGSGYVWQVQDLAPGQGGVITLSGALISPLRMGAFTNTAIAASEGNLGDTTATAGVMVPNAAPVAQDDTLATDEDMVLSLPCPPPAMTGVLSNDGDANGDTLQAVLAGDVSTGTLSLYSCGGYVYQPAPNFNGVVTFTYRASDTLAFSDLAVVTITVAPVDDLLHFYLPIVLK